MSCVPLQCSDEGSSVHGRSLAVATSRSSKRMGVVAYGLPQIDALPATGCSFSSNETIQSDGTVSPFFHALPPTSHYPSFTSLSSRLSRVQAPVCHSYVTLALTSSR